VDVRLCNRAQFGQRFQSAKDGQRAAWQIPYMVDPVRESIERTNEQVHEHQGLLRFHYGMQKLMK
jgi:hypothetical protein